jgi:biopolymer transport protein ExbD
VFFMVTSTYLDLDMIPAVSQNEENSSPPETAKADAQPILVRIGADGQPVLRGQPIDLEQLDALLRARLIGAPGLPVMILPTGLAQTQALVSVMDTATRAGVLNVRVIRLEGRP